MSLSLPEKVSNSNTRRRKACRESHSFQKHSSSTSTTFSSFPSASHRQHNHHHHHHPVITYTQAPKVIHTSPSEFMALVQKLTGLSREDVTEAAGAGEAKVMMHVDADTLQCSLDEPGELWSPSLCTIASKNECFDMGFTHIESVDSHCSQSDYSMFYPNMDELELDLVLENANFMVSNFSWRP